MTPAGAHLVLESLRDSARMQLFVLGEAAMRIGRAEGNDIVLDDKQVSRMHAEVAKEQQRFLVRDLGSRNGTFLNGRRIAEPVPLTTGDLLEIGPFQLQFIDPAGTELHSTSRVLVLDHRKGEVRLNGRLVDLAPKEYSLLRVLYERPGDVCERDEIAREVWSEPEWAGQVADAQIDNMVARLRQKVTPAGSGVQIVAIRGRGYKLVLPK